MTERLTEKLGYVFNDAALLTRALTHRSASASNYERLEFLGDGLLNFVVGEALFRARPQAEEGELSRLRASLVCEDSLAAIAEKLALGDELILGAGEMKSGGFRRHSILADTLESLLGAICLDGGFDAARDACLRLLAEPLAHLPDVAGLKDPKTRLQEYLQGRSRPLPLYEVIQAQGPAHRQSFTVRCRLSDSAQSAEGSAASRRGAEQEAADKVLRLIHA